MNKKQAGQIGGRATFARHGKQHMQTIGRAGAKVTWTRYKLAPVGGTGWVMVDRQSGEMKAVINFAGR
jgi:general stress protein YciG